MKEGRKEVAGEEVLVCWPLVVGGAASVRREKCFSVSVFIHLQLVIFTIVSFCIVRILPGRCKLEQ
jgi:hypothetical protein